MYLEVVGVELMALGKHYENCGSLCAPVLGVLIYLVIYVQKRKEGLGTTLVLDGN